MVYRPIAGGEKRSKGRRVIFWGKIQNFFRRKWQIYNKITNLQELLALYYACNGWPNQIILPISNSAIFSNKKTHVLSQSYSWSFDASTIWGILQYQSCFTYKNDGEVSGSKRNMSLPHKSDGLVLVEDTVVCPLLIQQLSKTINSILLHCLSSFILHLAVFLPIFFVFQVVRDYFVAF